MIRHTFSLLSGIGERLERGLWKRGILTWDDFTRNPDIEGISPERKSCYDDLLTHASIELGIDNAEYFARLLKRREHWRLFEHFGKGAVCLDIETNGFMPGAGGYTTVVGLYDGVNSRCLVRGRDLDAATLNEALAGYKCLITFYGSVFDVPFLQRTLPGVRFSIPHFDLCFGARKVGMEGGLKKLETMLGISRPERLQGMNGYDAVKLWQQAQNGSTEAMDILLEYNMEDTRHLLEIADVLYEKLKAGSGIYQYVERRHFCGCPQ